MRATDPILIDPEFFTWLGKDLSHKRYLLQHYTVWAKLLGKFGGKVLQKDFLQKNKSKIIEILSILVVNPQTQNYSSDFLEIFEKGVTFITGRQQTGNIPPKEEHKEIIDYLNEISKRTPENAYSHTNGNTQQLIYARLREGYTVEHFKRVIDRKWEQWKGTQAEIYMRPSTLFSIKHFEEYLKERPANDTANKGGTPDRLTEIRNAVTQSKQLEFPVDNKPTGGGVV